MTFFYDMLPLSLKKTCVYISIGFSVVFFLLLAWLGGVQVMEEIELGVTTDALSIPAACYSVGIPFFSVLIIARIVQASLKTLRENAF
jgi:TRAP-type C4-dicarboxylate transport system permease small subunit